MKINKFIIIPLILISIMGCTVKIERDFGQISNNPCETMYCKQHIDGTSICIIKCIDGLYALESNKFKISEEKDK